ncbi:MAG: OsmC family protein [Bacteroidales bacterium]|nr:OsmC family protein [Bacteroidales bacterium]
MGKDSASVSWKGNMAFEASQSGHQFMIDAEPHVGGEDLGPRPKAYMLTALAGCTAMDVVSILKKMRVELSDFKVTVDGELTDEHPKHFVKMIVKYEFWGKELPMDKIQKAINLSEERYCGVSVVYRKAMPVESEIILHED